MTAVLYTLAVVGFLSDILVIVFFAFFAPPLLATIPFFLFVPAILEVTLSRFKRRENRNTGQHSTQLRVDTSAASTGLTRVYAMILHVKSSFPLAICAIGSGTLASIGNTKEISKFLILIISIEANVGLQPEFRWHFGAGLRSFVLYVGDLCLICRGQMFVLGFLTEARFFFATGSVYVLIGLNVYLLALCIIVIHSFYLYRQLHLKI